MTYQLFTPKSVLSSCKVFLARQWGFSGFQSLSNVFAKKNSASESKKSDAVVHTSAFASVKSKEEILAAKTYIILNQNSKQVSILITSNNKHFK